MNTTKHEKFKRLARLRGNRALEDIRLLANLSNRNNYDYTDADVRKLFVVIEEELKTAKAKFTSSPKREIQF
jgi:hypothetical protein